jgi:hypothetical protein
VEAKFGGSARRILSADVDEKYHGKSLWVGTVHVFHVERAEDVGSVQVYAFWDRPGEEDCQPRTFLHEREITGPARAVRAYLAEQNGKNI